MDTSASQLCVLFFLLSLLIVCCSGSFISTANHFLHKQLDRPLLVQTTQHDTIEPPTTTIPTTPLTNPITTPSTGTIPPDFPTPPIVVTIPSANPTAPITSPPVTQDPITPPIPITNPVTTPSTIIPVGPQPVTNSVTTYPAPMVGNDPTTTPVVAPPGTATNSPAVPGQSWCVAKSGVPEPAIQAALDYACGISAADCSAIQQGANCYNPNSLQNHASYAFNSYYQRNPVRTSCDFGGAAMITNVNPSSGTCVFTTGSSSSASPTTASPVTTTPMTTPTTASPVTTTPTTESSSGATPSGSVTPPTVFNASSPSLGGGITGYGESPATANISSASSRPSSLQPFLGCIIVVTAIITGRTVLDV